MNTFEITVKESIIKTLKNHGLYQDLKGKIKFNRDKFYKYLTAFCDTKEYPAHIKNKIIDDALMNMKNMKEYHIAVNYLNGLETIQQNRNNRKLAYCTNVSKLVG